MPGRSIIAVSTLCVLLMSPCTGAIAQTADQLVGTWQLVSIVNTAADGSKRDAYGPHGKGLLIFTPDRHFTLINTDPDVPKVASNNRLAATPDENKAIVSGSIAYFGTYTISGTTITLATEGSTYPNYNGVAQTRILTGFTGSELKWHLPAPSTGAGTDTVWKKVDH